MVALCFIRRTEGSDLSFHMGKSEMRCFREIAAHKPSCSLGMMVRKDGSERQGKTLIAYESEIDSLEYSSIASSLKKGQSFRKETLHYIRASLKGDDAAARAASSHPMITCFKPVGDAVFRSCTPG